MVIRVLCFILWSGCAFVMIWVVVARAIVRVGDSFTVRDIHSCCYDFCDEVKIIVWFKVMDMAMLCMC